MSVLQQLSPLHVVAEGPRHEGGSVPFASATWSATDASRRPPVDPLLADEPPVVAPVVVLSAVVPLPVLVVPVVEPSVPVDGPLLPPFVAVDPPPVNAPVVLTDSSCVGAEKSNNPHPAANRLTKITGVTRNARFSLLRGLTMK